jgi:DNA mismatch repair protein MutS
MVLDETAVETLELFPGLFSVLNQTMTPMGARLLREWMLRPLLATDAIRERQDAVAALHDAPAARAAVRRLLGQIGDIERLTSRAAMRLAHGRDLVGLRASLRPLGELRAAVLTMSAPVLDSIAAELADLEELRGLLERALTDEPPLGLHDGGLIRPKWSDALETVTQGARAARDWIAALEDRERERTGIPTLRVRFNRVFGYGIEVSRAQAARVPADYIRRQTLAGAERYVTAELRDYEATVLGADERIRRLEYELFTEVRDTVAANADTLLRTAAAVARLDVLAALGEVAHSRGHTRPTVDQGAVFSVTGGRHPVLEAATDRQVTPNDLALDAGPA